MRMELLRRLRPVGRRRRPSAACSASTRPLSVATSASCSALPGVGGTRGPAARWWRATPPSGRCQRSRQLRARGCRPSSRSCPSRTATGPSGAGGRSRPARRASTGWHRPHDAVLLRQRVGDAHQLRIGGVVAGRRGRRRRSARAAPPRPGQGRPGCAGPDAAARRDPAGTAAARARLPARDAVVAVGAGDLLRDVLPGDDVQPMIRHGHRQRRRRRSTAKPSGASRLADLRRSSAEMPSRRSTRGSSTSTTRGARGSGSLSTIP